MYPLLSWLTFLCGKDSTEKSTIIDSSFSMVFPEYSSAAKFASTLSLVCNPFFLSIAVARINKSLTVFLIFSFGFICRSNFSNNLIPILHTFSFTRWQCMSLSKMYSILFFSFFCLDFSRCEILSLKASRFLLFIIDEIASLPNMRYAWYWFEKSIIRLSVRLVPIFAHFTFPAYSEYAEIRASV